MSLLRPRKSLTGGDSKRVYTNLVLGIFKDKLVQKFCHKKGKFKYQKPSQTPKSPLESSTWVI